jgi:CarboxypepD_reg-like domain
MLRKGIAVWGGIWLIWAILSNPLYSQTLTIEGKITDAETQLPLSFASVGIEGSSVGTLANEQGIFKLKISAQYADRSILVTYMGYQSFKLLLREAVAQNPLQIKLMPNVQNLTEVVVKPVSAIDILLKVVEKLPQNYDLNPAVLEGFYRESVKQTNTSNYYAFSEGVIQLYKPGTMNNSPDRARMIKGRKKDLSRLVVTNIGDTVTVPEVINGPYLGYFLDIIKSREFPFVSNDSYLSDSYVFEYDGAESIGNTYLYKIKFRPNPLKKRELMLATIPYFGIFYIDTEQFVIVKAEYELTRDALSRYEANHRGMTLNARKYSVSYAPFETKWYLHDARVSNDFTFNTFYPTASMRKKSSRKRIPVGMGLYNQMTFVTTSIDNKNPKPFDNKQIIGLYDSFSEQTMTFDANFWKDFNIIEEEKP